MRRLASDTLGFSSMRIVPSLEMKGRNTNEIPVSRNWTVCVVVVWVDVVERYPTRAPTSTAARWRFSAMTLGLASTVVSVTSSRIRRKALTLLLIMPSFKPPAPAVFPTVDAPPTASLSPG